MSSGQNVAFPRSVCDLKATSEWRFLPFPRNLEFLPKRAVAFSLSFEICFTPRTIIGFGAVFVEILYNYICIPVMHLWAVRGGCYCTMRHWNSDTWAGTEKKQSRQMVPLLSLACLPPECYGYPRWEYLLVHQFLLFLFFRFLWFLAWIFCLNAFLQIYLYGDRKINHTTRQETLWSNWSGTKLACGMGIPRRELLYS